MLAIKNMGVILSPKETDGDDSSYERGYSIIGTGFGSTNSALSIGVATDAKAKGQQVYEKRE